ncbi:hypothetical protein BT63DRAFT_457049 [Microthyrium microscopicum]|uniref:Rhodopsin domain-containing protein n=1 Tax=Microthyrium microscopicum TaxID=703497 RepID=A0A6A6U8H6_9PEZI|nr:hypothetical protein BT63DRAFT_457049 [Microthyrium microscopicum]
MNLRRSTERKSQFVPLHDPSIQTQIAFGILVWLFVAIRFIVRAHYYKVYGLDDYFMFASLLIFTAATVTTSKLLALILGGQIMAFMNELVVVCHISSEIYVVSAVLVIAATICVKVSIACFLLRLIVSKWQRAVMYIITAVTILANSISGLFYLITCGSPRNSILYEFTGVCLGYPKIPTKQFVQLVFGLSVYTNVGVDVIMSVLSIFMMFSEMLDKKQKVSIAFFIGFSLAGCAFAVAKIYFTDFRIQADGGSWGDVQSIQYDVSIAVTFNQAEVVAYIIGGCVVTFRPLFIALADTCTGRRRKNSSGISIRDSSSNSARSALARRLSAGLNLTQSSSKSQVNHDVGAVEFNMAEMRYSASGGNERQDV